MAAKLKVELILLNKLTKPLDMAKGKVKRLGFDLRKTFTNTNTLLGKAVSGFRRFGTAIGGSVKKIFNLRNAIVALAIGAVIKKVIGAAASMEVFANQLLVVTGSAEKAAVALEAIREFARTSPLETEDVVQSYVRLRAVGIDPTMKQMRTLGGVAVLMNREMTEVLDSFIGLNKRTLRRLGIDIDRTGQKAIIQSGNVRKVVEKDTASIRGALLEVWEERFPNAIETAANTTKAKTAIMKSNVYELSVAVGEHLLPAWNAIVNAISKASEKLKDFLAGIKSDKETLETNTANAQQLEIISKAAAELAKEYDKTKKSLDSISETSAGFVDTSTMLLLTNEDIFKLAQKEERLLKAIRQLKKDSLGFAKKEKEVKVDPLGGTGTLGTGTGKETGKGAAKKAMQDAIKQIKFEAQARKESAEAIAEFNKLVEGEEIKRFEAEIDRSEKRMQQMKDEYDLAWRIGLQGLQDDADANQKKLDYNAQLKSSAQALFAHSSNLLKRGISESKRSAKEKKNILLGMAVAEAAAASVSVIKKAVEGGGGFFSSLLKAAAGLVAVAAMTAGQIAAINSASFARGTSRAPGGMALVGEEGPEMVNLPGGSQVFTAPQTRNMIGGSTISPTIIIEGNATKETVGQLSNVLDGFMQKLEDGIRKGNIDLARLGIATV